MHIVNFDIKNIKAIIGLGNPGAKYYYNRHNIGFRFLDKILQNYNIDWAVLDFMEYAKISLYINNSLQQIILIKPLTFMNNSGKIIPFLNKKRIKSENMLVVHDELEKDFGKIILKFAGSARGHNGLRSIINNIGYNFWRLGFGIGRPDNKKDVANYVLSNFSEEEERKIDILMEEGITKIFQ